jgi:hypothetical protein
MLDSVLLHNINHLLDRYEYMRKCDGVRRHLHEPLSRCLVVSAALCVASGPFN